MSIGLIPMSAKPYHKGHDNLIRTASKENEKVIVLVSLVDRKRPGEVIIKGDDMRIIWQKFIEPTLPGNVDVRYVTVPITAAWELLGEANELGSIETFKIYGDPEDLADRFSDVSLEKYAKNLYDDGQIIIRSVDRGQTSGISGTQMRTFLMMGDADNFMRGLPATIDKQQVWNVLASDIQLTPQKKTTKKTSRS